VAAQQQQKRTHWRSVHKRKDPTLLYAEDLGPPGTTVDVEMANHPVEQLTS